MCLSSCCPVTALSVAFPSRSHSSFQYVRCSHSPSTIFMGLSLGTSPYPLDFDLQDQGNDRCYDLLNIRNQVVYSSERSLSIMNEGGHLISQLTPLTSSLQPEKFSSPISEPTEAQRETCRGASDLIRCPMIKLCETAPYTT